MLPGAYRRRRINATPFRFVLAAMLCVSTARADVPTPGRDFSRAEAGEALPGGQATSRKAGDRHAFSHPSANLKPSQGLDFRVGNGFFKRLWVSAPSSTRSADGLGPLFNARACQQCHIRDGRGHPPAANWPADNAVSMLLRLSVPPATEAQRRQLAEGRMLSIPEPTYGSQLQDFALQGLRPEGRLHVTYEPLPVRLADGTVVNLRKPDYTVTELAYGPLHPDTMLSPRIAPPMIGLGLLEVIPEADILAKADPDDTDGDGISGKPQMSWDRKSGRPALGRYGWKAGTATVRQQVADAFAGDIGISTPLAPRHWGDCTDAQPDCLGAPSGATDAAEGVEATAAVLDLVTFYSLHLAVPKRRKAGDKQVLAGKRVFYQAGCVACHTPKYVTATDPERPALSGQLIWPYTDLLLHDMGDGLADGRPEGKADGREWRTPPLWGLGLTETVNGHTDFLHDGRARTLLEAIVWHGGEAEPARERVRALSAGDRAALLAFLESL